MALARGCRAPAVSLRRQRRRVCTNYHTTAILAAAAEGLALSRAPAEGDLLRIELSNGTTVRVEVTEVDEAAAELRGSGERLRWIVQLSAGRARASGLALSPTERWVSSFDGWKAALRKDTSPKDTEKQWLEITACEIETSLAELHAAVRADARRWCDGTAEGDAPLTDAESATLAAGELLSLLEGKRGACMIQLFVGWDASLSTPAYNPFVLRLLRECVRRKDVGVLTSEVRGSEKNLLGLSAIVFAEREPWTSWAPHLAEFGAQASLIAQSPYYGLLVGRILGYAEENIRTHVQGQGQKLSPEIEEAATQTLAQLSSQAPELPWTTTAAELPPPPSAPKARSSGGFGKKRR